MLFQLNARKRVELLARPIADTPGGLTPQPPATTKCLHIQSIALSALPWIVAEQKHPRLSKTE